MGRRVQLDLPDGQPGVYLTIMDEIRLFQVWPPRNGTERRSGTLLVIQVFPFAKLRSLKI